MFDWRLFKKCVTETKKIVCQNVHQKVFPFKTSLSLSLSFSSSLLHSVSLFFSLSLTLSISFSLISPSLYLPLSPSFSYSPFLRNQQKSFLTSQVNSVKYQKSLTRWENSIFHTTTSNFVVYK